MITVTEEQKKRDLATQIISREREMYHYQASIDNYAAILAASPGEWPENLVSFKGKSREAVAEQVENVEQLQLISALLTKDEATKLMRITIIECAKVKLFYEALLTQIDPVELSALLAEISAT